jgi:hypothetical protein
MRYAISYGKVHEFVLDNDLTDNDTIVLHPEDYEVVAAEYLSENNFTLYRPVEVLGVKVLEDTDDEVKKKHICVMPLKAS